jgi:hypothetical protein
MDISTVANAVSAAIIQQTQAANAASVVALAAIVSGNAPASTPTQYNGSTSLLDTTA